MDQLDENLRELRKRFDTKLEHMLIVRRAESAEAQSSSGDSLSLLDKLWNYEPLDPGASDRPALTLPKGEDPTIAYMPQQIDGPVARDALAPNVDRGVLLVMQPERHSHQEANLNMAASPSKDEPALPKPTATSISHLPAIPERGLWSKFFHLLLRR